MTWDRQLHLEPHRSDFAIVEQWRCTEHRKHWSRHMPSSKMWQCGWKAVLPIEFTSAFGGNAGLAEAWQRQRHTVKYVPVGFPPVMGSSPNPSFHGLGLWPIIIYIFMACGPSNKFLFDWDINRDKNN
jgi:hypothetical protein